MHREILQPRNHEIYFLIQHIDVFMRFHLRSFLCIDMSHWFRPPCVESSVIQGDLIWRVHGSINILVDRLWGFHSVVILLNLHHELLPAREYRPRHSRVPCQTLKWKHCYFDIFFFNYLQQKLSWNAITLKRNASGYTESSNKMLSFWVNFHHCLQQKWS